MRFLMDGCEGEDCPPAPRVPRLGTRNGLLIVALHAVRDLTASAGDASSGSDQDLVPPTAHTVEIDGGPIRAMMPK